MQGLGDGVWRLESTGRITAAYLVAADEPVLIDTGTRGRAARLADELAAATPRPRMIVLTHGDVDHIGGAEILRRRFGLEVWAPAGDRALIDHGSRGGGPLPRLARRLARLEPPAVDHWFEPGDTIGGLHVIATPGHTPGHVSLRRGDVLIAGDAIRTGEHFRLPPRFMNADHAEAARSIGALAKLDDLNLAVSGHGAPARDATTKLRRLANELHLGDRPR